MTAHDAQQLFAQPSLAAQDPRLREQESQPLTLAYSTGVHVYSIAVHRCQLAAATHGCSGA